LNVGSLLRSTEGLGIDHIYLTGYTPYPSFPGDKRLPHIANKVNAKIAKTALGAEIHANWSYKQDIFELVEELKSNGYKILALEQTDSSTPLHKAEISPKMALICGREVDGIETEVLSIADEAVEIPMAGHKESFNVATAAAMALYIIKLKSNGQIATIDDKI